MALPKIQIEIEGDASGASSSINKTTAELDKLDRSLDGVTSSAKRTAPAVEATGRASVSAAQKAKIAAAAADELGRANRRATGQTANLTAQLNDIGVMLAAGQSPLQLAVQQGTQINQVFSQLGGGAQAVKSLGAAFVSMINPLSLLTIGVIAGGAALVQWGMNALKATDDGGLLQERMKQLREATAALSMELREIRLGVTPEELTLMDSIAQKTREIADLEETIRNAQGRGREAIINLVNQQLGPLRQALDLEKEQLATLKQMQFERDRLLEVSAATADQERLLGEQMGQTQAELAESEGIARLLRDGISAATIEAMKLAGVDISGAISPAANEAARLAENMGIAYDAAVQYMNAVANFNPTPAMSDEDALMSQSVLPDASVRAGQRNAVRNFGRITAARRSPGGRGGGGGGSGSAVDPNAARIEALVESLKTEREILEEWRAEGLELLAQANAAELEALGGHNEAKLRLEQEYQERLGRIQEATRQFTLQGALKGGAEVLSAMGAFNQKALKISQVFAAGEALISTYKGAAKELEKGTFGFATAAAVIAKGLSFVAAIKGVSASGTGAGSVGGGARAANANAAPAPQTQNVVIDLVGASQTQVDQYQVFADTMNEAARQGLLTNLTVRSA